jgi:hypothetical protein
MFDLVDGLPVHALVVHVVVVLLPLMAVLSLAFVVRPRWRRGLPWAVLGNIVVVASVVTAKESGEKLQARLSALTHSEVATAHQHLADNLLWFAIAQLVASVIAWWLVRPGRADTRPAAGPLTTALVLTLVAGVASIAWCYRVGESGARAVWGDTVKATQSPQPSP